MSTRQLYLELYCKHILALQVTRAQFRCEILHLYGRVLSLLLLLLLLTLPMPMLQNQRLCEPVVD